MSPTNLYSFLFFFFFLVPGLYYDFLAKKHQGQRKESSLQELGRIVLSSCFFITPSVFASLNIFKHFNSSSFYISDVLESPIAFTVGHTRLFIYISMLTLALSATLALITDNFFVALNKPHFSSDSVWLLLFTRKRLKQPAGIRYPFVKPFRVLIRKYRIFLYGRDYSDYKISCAALVTTIDAKKHLGVMSIWSSEEYVPGRDIVLAPLNENQISHLPPYFKKHLSQNSQWMAIGIPESAISSIEVFYFKSRKSAPKKKPKPSFRARLALLRDK